MFFEIMTHLETRISTVGSFPVISNVNPLRLQRLLEVIAQTDRQEQFIDKDKELIVIGRNHRNLYLFMEELLPQIMAAHSGPYPESSFMFPHHFHGKSTMNKYVNISYHPGEPVKIISRTKGTASIVEKMARIYAEKGAITDAINPAHTLEEDIYGISAGMKRAEECYLLQDKLGTLPFLSRDSAKSKDYLHGNPNGYRALHDTFYWNNGFPELKGMRIRVHYETEADFVKNRDGDGKNPRRAHRAYASCKLEKPHSLGKYQVVVVDHRSNLEVTFSHKRIDLSDKLNGQVQYHLLCPQVN